MAVAEHKGHRPKESCNVDDCDVVTELEDRHELREAANITAKQTVSAARLDAKRNGLLI